MRLRLTPGLGATIGALVLASAGRAHGQAPTTAVADSLPLGRPLAPGAPSRPPLPPDTSGRALVARALAAPRRAVVRDAGPGPAGRLLAAALAAPHVLVVAPARGLVLGRDVRIDRTLVVVGDAHVAATVRGDVLVLGQLFLRPGALVDGRAVALGGTVQHSTLALVRGGTLAYRELGFGASDVAGGVLALDSRPLSPRPETRLGFPGPLGLRLPDYTRIDGLALTAGPEIHLDTGRVRVEPLVTYRSHLGAVDPSLLVLGELTRRVRVEARVGRTTATNERWIRSDPLNAAITFASGRDVRNYYRADRGELSVARRLEGASVTLTPFVGLAAERAWSVRRDSLGASVPFSVLGRDDPEAMRRPNPGVTGGRITSAVGGARLQGGSEQIAGVATLYAEQALATTRGSRFTQATLDAEVGFAAFRDHRVEGLLHAVGTVGADVPTQRHAWLGGQGTLPTRPLLERGGDQLVWLETRYVVPISRVELPVAGVPLIAVRHMVGGAGVDRLPALTQNLGLRLTIAGLRFDYTIDPARPRDQHVTLGLGLVR